MGGNFPYASCQRDVPWAFNFAFSRCNKWMPWCTPSSVRGIVVMVLVLFATTCKAVCAFLTTFVPACAHAFQAQCPGVRSITQLSNLNFQGLVIFTDGGTETANGDTTAGCARLGPILSRFYECVMFELVVTFPAHPAFSGASRHINNTDELSGFIIFVFKNFSQIKGLCLEVPMFVFCCFK